MYKIYINGTPLYLAANSKEPIDQEKSLNYLGAHYTEKPRALLNYVDLLEKSTRYDFVVVEFSDVKKLFADFKSLFKIVSAAGGLVQNSNNELLGIYRKGFWDLPKGKIDSGETKREAAVREVEEETGVQGVIHGKRIHVSYHTYKIKKTRILKPTYWYVMEARSPIKVVVQESEGIEDFKWFLPKENMQDHWKSYPNINELIKVYLSKKQMRSEEE